MLQRRAKVTRILLSTVALIVSAGTAVATADEPPVSPPELYRATSGSANLAADGYDGAGVTVAVIDTGVADVPGMHGKVIHQENLSSAPDAGDQYGHGTFVAGVVHAAAPQAEIVSIKLSDANGSVDVTQVLAALQWVIANKERFSIDVVNLSFGN
ncbi:MAG: alkaline serine protease, partial [Thermoleophilia bacterium]|nr:alkaline serine protease [Thermoleophilia bacterium]